MFINCHDIPSNYAFEYQSDGLITQRRKWTGGRHKALK